MLNSGRYSVSIFESGRSGSIICRQGIHSLEFHWEFGGGDMIVIIQVSDDAAWVSPAAWFADRRAEILRIVADEAIRLRAPTCHADIDETTGTILLRQDPAPAEGEAAAPSQPARETANTVQSRSSEAAFVRRYVNIRAMFALGLLIVVVIGSAVLVAGRYLLTVAPASGVPLGETVRTDAHIVTLIQTTDPHLPHWSGRGGSDTTSISVFLIPLDGSAPRHIPVFGKLSGQAHSLARIIGSDGHTLWLDATGLSGVRLSDFTLVQPSDLQEANRTLDAAWWGHTRGMEIVDGRLHILNDDRSAAVDVDPATWTVSFVTPKPSNARFDRKEPGDLLVAGFVDASGAWLGLHSFEERDQSFKPGEWLSPVERATEAKQKRQLCKADLEPASDGRYFKVRSISPVSDTTYLNAAFLRIDATSAPVRLTGPGGTLMLYTSEPGLNGRLKVARVDLDGTVRWDVETGIERFQLQQILPGADVFGFVGLRPQVPDKLSEPVVVLVDNSTGRLVTHSLWR